MYDDGTPFFYLGDTHWLMFKEEFDEKGSHAVDIETDSHFKYIVDKRVEQKFTVYQSEPIDHKYNIFDGIDEEDIKEFQRFDKYFQYIASKGLVHANAQLIFPKTIREPFYDEEFLRTVTRFWVARYASYPVLWTLGQEVDSHFYGFIPGLTIENNPYRNMCRFLYAFDPYRHPITGHQENAMRTGALGNAEYDNTEYEAIPKTPAIKYSGKSAFYGMKEHTWWGIQWRNLVNKQYNFNIPKDGWMFGMGSGQQEAIVCAENYVFDKAAVVDGTDLELEYVSDENNAAWVAESLNRLVTAVLNSDGTDIDTTIAQYLDIDSAIDYLIFTVMNYGTDNTGKNYILATYDGVKWFFSAYDMDGVWGLRWDGKTFFSADINHAISAGSLKGYARVHTLMKLLYTHKYSAIQKRYWELRSGPLSDGNVEKTFTDYASHIHRTLLEEDARLWPTIPSTETNDVSQIIGWFHTRRKGMDADVGQLEETGVTYYPDINGFIRLNGSVSTSANYRRTDYLPLAGVKEIEYLSFVVKGSSMATWALFDQSKRWIVSSQDENGTEYYNVNIAGNTVTYGLLRKTLMVEELLEQYPGTAYIVLSTNNHADYEAKMDINNVNFGWSSEKQYITLRSVASGPETDVPQNVNYGSENAGKLLYVGSDGFATVLALGAGLTIVDGVLTITSQIVTSAICGQAVCGKAICGGA
jgi:hypothetical protein